MRRNSMAKKLKLGTDLINAVKEIILETSYPIGSIYISINNTNPSNFVGGTWEQLTGDAYLKIVTSNAGELGGTSSQHKIPVSSIPSHRHLESHVAGPRGGGGSQYDWNTMLTNGANNTGGWNNYSAYEGGGNPYYPYYYGVYVFKRTA